MADVICMGELLIDFVPTRSGVSLVEAPSFKKAAGGAPANVAVGLARLGVRAGFMGKVGDDAFGHFLAQSLADSGVDITSLVFSNIARTALAFVSLTSSGERDFMFYRHPSADMLFEPREVNEGAIGQARIFHFGSITLISEPSRSATLHALDVAERGGLIISYDPNLRLPLWSSEDQAMEQMLAGWDRAHIVKASAEEIAFLSGEDDLSSGVAALWKPKLKLVVATQGAGGCSYFTRKAEGHVAGFSVDTVDTTGAGDGFVAGLLLNVLAHPALWEDVPALQEALRYANAVGALTTTQLGAIPALPRADAVQQLMRR
jgi:fructokinase